MNTAWTTVRDDAPLAFLIPDALKEGATDDGVRKPCNSTLKPNCSLLSVKRSGILHLDPFPLDLLDFLLIATSRWVKSLSLFYVVVSEGWAG